MAKQKIYKTKTKTGKVKERAATYGKPVLRVFNSFKEAEDYDIQQTLKQDPVERIRETVELILRVYGFTRAELNQRPPDNTLKIIRYE